MSSLLLAPLFLVMLVSSGFLSGCGDPDGAASDSGDAYAPVPRKERDPKIFHRLLGEPEYLDPGLMTESEGGDVATDCFEGLYVFGRTHREWLPGVATSMEVSSDRLTYTFHLRPEARWSDGVPVTAHDFEFAWKRVLDPATASRYAGIMWLIEGARAFNSAKPDEREALREKVRARALDDLTFEVKLAYPAPYFKQLLAFYTFSPVPKHRVEALGDAWIKPENYVSNGPHHVVEWVQLQRIVALRNPYYWNNDAIAFDKIVYHIVQENEPGHNLYLASEIDFMADKVPPSILPKYRLERFPDLHGYDSLGSYFYMFNVTSPPFDDVRVRRALGLAIDKELIGKYVVKGGQQAANSIVPKVLAEAIHYPASSLPMFDPVQAKRLLAEAGYPEGRGFPVFKIVYNTAENHKLIAQFIQRQWRKNLGIQADLDNMEWKVLLKKQNAGDFQVSRYAWIGDFLDPITFLDLFEADNPNNRTNWKNAAYDRLLARARLTVDPAARQALLAQAEQLLLDDMPIIPIYSYVMHDLVKPWLRGYEPHVQGAYPARYFSIELD